MPAVKKLKEVRPNAIRPSQYAKNKRVSPQVVNNWIKRGKVETIYDNKLKLRLVVME
jgi:hypothetical protein